MNLSELKENFYKRFDRSSNFLHFTSCGMLCTLLGNIDIETAPSLNCTLSMRTEIFARKLNGNVINVEDSRSNKCFCYNFNTPSELFRGRDKMIVELINSCNIHELSGCELLYQISIPDFLSCTESFSAAFIQSLLKVSDIQADILEIAAICSSYASVSHTLAILSSKKGYCTLIDSGKPKNFPLPLSGYKLLSAHLLKKDRNRTPRINHIMSIIHRMYPHILSIGDVTDEILYSIKPSVKDETALNYMYHLAGENMRIKTVTNALKRCDIKTLFEEMKNSQRSMERLWNPIDEQNFLAHITKKVDGVMATRFWDNGIVAIVENEKIDYAINMIKSDFQNNVGYQPTFCVSEIY